jgi:hypothetical protein
MCVGTARGEPRTSVSSNSVIAEVLPKPARKSNHIRGRAATATHEMRASGSCGRRIVAEACLAEAASAASSSRKSTSSTTLSAAQTGCKTPSLGCEFEPSRIGRERKRNRPPGEESPITSATRARRARTRINASCDRVERVTPWPLWVRYLPKWWIAPSAIGALGSLGIVEDTAVVRLSPYPVSAGSDPGERSAESALES